MARLLPLDHENRGRRGTHHAKRTHCGDGWTRAVGTADVAQKRETRHVVHDHDECAHTRCRCQHQQHGFRATAIDGQNGCARENGHQEQVSPESDGRRAGIDRDEWRRACARLRPRRIARLIAKARRQGLAATVRRASKSGPAGSTRRHAPRARNARPRGPDRSCRKGQQDRCDHCHDADDDWSVEKDQNRCGSDEHNEYEERDQHDAAADNDFCDDARPSRLAQAPLSVGRRGRRYGISPVYPSLSTALVEGRPASGRYAFDALARIGDRSADDEVIGFPRVAVRSGPTEKRSPRFRAAAVPFPGCREGAAPANRSPGRERSRCRSRAAPRPPFRSHQCHRLREPRGNLDRHFFGNGGHKVSPVSDEAELRLIDDSAAGFDDLQQVSRPRIGRRRLDLVEIDQVVIGDGVDAIGRGAGKRLPADRCRCRRRGSRYGGQRRRSSGGNIAGGGRRARLRFLYLILLLSENTPCSSESNRSHREYSSL